MLCLKRVPLSPRVGRDLAIVAIAWGAERRWNVSIAEDMKTCIVPFAMIVIDRGY